MQTTPHIDDVRAARWRDPTLTWGLVPTMGYLHDGHVSLVQRAREENDRVAASIFVNPTQFGDPGDLEKYPRNLERDIALLRDAGVDLVWTPSPDLVYPPQFQTYVEVEQVARPLEGAARPGHFRGVTTVVAKLFNVFQPNRAYFGQKDAQQVIVIKRMVDDLNFNLEIVVCPTVRESDGLAMSSRNARLSDEARSQAVSLFRALETAQRAIDAGARDGEQLRQQMREIVARYSLARIDYVSVANATTLEELTVVVPPVLLSLAVYVDDIRLIDNILIDSLSHVA